MLLVVGPTAEERFGGKRILLAIALTALVTGLVLWFFFPNSALMGASGVVFMLIVLASFAGMRTGTIPLTLILVLILYLGSEIFQAVTGTLTPGDGVTAALLSAHGVRVYGEDDVAELLSL